MDWITSTDLVHWSDKRVSEELLPEVLRRLIYTLTERRAMLDMPSGDSVSTGGWDGQVEVSDGTEHIPAGKSVWEFGTNKDIKGKADDEYNKRTTGPGDVTPDDTTFVFVTSRRWPFGKKRWSSEKRAEGVWKDVRVLDADDLEYMLEQTPAVALWLAEHMGKITGSFLSLEEYWNDWSSETDPPISTELVLAGREESVEDLVEWPMACHHLAPCTHTRQTKQSHSLLQPSMQPTVQQLKLPWPARLSSRTKLPSRP